MRLHPFYECVEDAERLIGMGHQIFQQFNCSHCGVKQTMEQANVFYKTGKCGECGEITDIEKEGCNYMLHAVIGKARREDQR